MTLKEKTLYHQIVPAKLATDWMIGGLLSYFLLWSHHLLAGILMTIVPSVLASVVVIRYVNLQPYKSSKLGRYVKRFMTNAMQSVRSIGGLIVAIAAWYHSPLFITVGLVIILYGWLNGLVRLR